MRVENFSKEQIRDVYGNLNDYINSGYVKKWVKYLDLGTHIVRLINYSDEFTPHVQRQLTYVLKDSAEKYDATIVVWKENNFKKLPEKLGDNFNPKTNLRLRVEMLALRKNSYDLRIMDLEYSKHNPALDINISRGILSGYDEKNNTHYYAVENLEPEEFIKEGHIFVKIFNKILKTESSNLVHGAVVGLNNTGVLFCARGQRGKSTLAVLAMMKEFDYVSDDYLTLEKNNDKLYAHPIYSIITLSPRMYNELYCDFKGQFVSNNARKDKYVLNIEQYHNTFKRKYPVSVCMFPEIVSDEKPSIVPMKHKGRAITQLIHSTVNQTGDRHDITTVKKIMDFVKDYEFYQINLCSDINANVECLRKFIEKIAIKEKEKRNDELCVK